MRKSEIVLIEWKQRGALIRNGLAEQRWPGDEDLVPYGCVRGSVESGKAVIKDKEIKKVG